VKKVKVSISIMAHHSRVKLYIPRLIKAIGEEYDVKVAIDYVSSGAWQTARRAWMLFDDDSTHHILLQDDVMVCKNFMLATHKICKAYNNHCITFHSHRKIADEALEKGLNYAKFHYVTGQALCMPVEKIKQFVAWSDKFVDDKLRYDDSRLSMFNTIHQYEQVITVPNLVQHFYGGSILGTPTNNKQARTYPGDEFDALSVNWSRTKSLAGSKNLPNGNSDWQYCYDPRNPVLRKLNI
jgi:hypothetical protein